MARTDNSTETKETYNGWTNYETWVTKLWMDNDRGSQEHYAELAARVVAESTANEFMSADRVARYDLHKLLKEEFEESNPLCDQANLWADLMNAALSEVNWYEIADSLIDDLPEEKAEEE